MYFDKGMFVDAASGYQVPYEGLAKFAQKGYSGFLHGNVVDMLYFPLVENYMMPDWVPFSGSKPFTFFAPIFNIADASISCGVIVILLFQKRFFRQHEEGETGTTVETSAAVNDESQVL
jgi:signal peptidase II